MGLFKNKRGFSLIYGLMLATIVILLALALAPALQDTTFQARNDTLLNCSTTTNPQTKAICTSIDLNMLWIGILLGSAGIIIWRMV